MAASEDQERQARRDAERDAAPGPADSVGQTGGLPGANADPRTAELGADEAADTTSMADTAAPAPSREEDLERPPSGNGSGPSSS